MQALECAGISVGERMGPDTHGDGGGTYRACYADARQVALSLAPPSGPLPRARSRRTVAVRGHWWRGRATTLAAVRHTNLAATQEALTLPLGWVGLTTTLVEGVELGSLIAWHGFLTRAETAQVVSDVAAALTALHEAGLSHGDLSPANVLVGDDGRCVLVDLLGRPGEQGTEPWSAPETRPASRSQAGREGAGENGDEEPAPLERPGIPADVYSLARLALTCVGASSVLVGEIEPVLRQALSPDPAVRPTAAQVADALASLDGTRPPQVPEGLLAAAPDWFAPGRTPTLRPAQARRSRPRRSQSRDRRTGRSIDALNAPSAPEPRHAPVPIDAAFRPQTSGPRADSRRTGPGGVLLPRPRGARVGRRVRLASPGWRTAARVGTVLAMVAAGVSGGAHLLAAGPGTRPLAISPSNPPTAGGSHDASSSPTPSGSHPHTHQPGSVTRPIPQHSATSAATTPQGQAPDETESPVDAVRRLLAARDAALTAADAHALASLSVPGSPAARSDAQVLAALEQAGERAEGLHTAVLEVRELGTEEASGRSRVSVRLRQEAHTRIGRDGSRREVAAQEERRVVVVLEPGPWRVAEVRADG